MTLGETPLALAICKENAECRTRIDVVRRERLQLIQATILLCDNGFVLRLGLQEAAAGHQRQHELLGSRTESLRAKAC